MKLIIFFLTVFWGHPALAQDNSSSTEHIELNSQNSSCLTLYKSSRLKEAIDNGNKGAAELRKLMKRAGLWKKPAKQ